MTAAVVAIALAAILVLALLLGYTLRILDRKEREWAKERNLLITRIQTPELATAIAAAEIPPVPEDPTLYSPERELQQAIESTIGIVGDD